MVKQEGINMNDTLEAQYQVEALPFVPVDLTRSLIVCGDDREIAYPNECIHIFGGALYTPYLLSVLIASSDPNSTPPNFIDNVNSLIPLMLSRNFDLSVHSDDKNENGLHDIDVSNPELIDVGCGFAQKRQMISSFIGQNQNQILSIAQNLRPELFGSEQELSDASAIIKAHQTMAKSLNTSGRELVKKSLELGAYGVVVLGPHKSNRGVYNLRRNTSLDTNLANQNQNPAYIQDAWAVIDIVKGLSDIIPLDIKKVEIADLIDSIGIMLALGVDPDEIEVRR